MRNLAGEFNVLQDDASRLAKHLSDKKSRAIVTPPPYHDHRHYGSNKGEIEREQAVSDYPDSLAAAFSACRRLLTDDGSLWIVMGVGARTTGTAALSLGRRFTGIDIYADNVAKTTKNISAAASLITGHAPRTV